jgi:hypothetical protein
MREMVNLFASLLGGCAYVSKQIQADEIVALGKQRKIICQFASVHAALLANVLY